MITDSPDQDEMTWLLHAVAAAVCPVCQHYASRRLQVIPMAVVHTADRVGVDPMQLLRRYMGSVHLRHLGGGSLSTRPSTPAKKLAGGGSQVRVHRACNGCGADVGDTNEAEMGAAVAGAQLPDVRLECGCFTREERAS